jgi:hypothetical protein
MVTDEPAGEADQIGAKVVSQGRYVTFRMAGVAVLPSALASVKGA